MDMVEIKSNLHHHVGALTSGSISPPSEAEVENLIEKQDRMCTTLRDTILFDAIAPQFHISVFLYQFFSHMILPLYFFLPNLYGQGFRPSFELIWFNIILPCVFYTMVITFVLLSTNDKLMVGYSVWWPFFAYIAHRITLSLKYATLSPTEYKRFNDCTDNKMSASYLDQMMLFSGWFELLPEVLFFELGAASARIGERINEIHLIVRNENHSDVTRTQVCFWNAFLRGQREISECTTLAPEMRKIESGDYAISVYDIAVAVIRYCNTTHEFKLISLRLTRLIALTIIVVSYIPLMNSRDHVESPALVALYMLSSTIINWSFGRLIFLFLSLVLFDVTRLLKMVKIVHCMIRITDVSMGTSVSLNGNVSEKSQTYAQQRREAIIDINRVRSWKGSVSLNRSGKARSDSRDEDYNPRTSNVIGEKIAVHGGEALIPRVAFEFPENILAWAYLRIAIQAFGERFRYRTDIYAGFTLMIMLVLMIMALSYLIISSNRQTEFRRTYVLESIIAVTVLVVFLLLISISGAMVNEELDLQSRTLASRALRTRSRLVFREEIEADDLEGGVDRDTELLAKQFESIEAVMEIVNVNNELRPFKFLGVTAQYAWTVSILTTVVSFYSVLFSLYFSSNSSVSSELSYT